MLKNLSLLGMVCGLIYTLLFVWPGEYGRSLAGAQTLEGETYPVNMTLSNADGTQLDVQVLSRTEDKVTFIRLSDGKQFTYPISRLSQVDGIAVRALPNTADEYRLRDSVMNRDLARMEEKLAELNFNAQAPELTTAQQQMITREIVEVTEEIRQTRKRLSSRK